jgi:hypothetical protein
MKYNKVIGKAKGMQNRLAGYLSMINFMMVLYLYIKSQPFGLNWFQWIVLMSVGISIVMFVDNYILLASETHYLWSKNPWAVEMQKDIKEIKEKLEIK